MKSALDGYKENSSYKAAEAIPSFIERVDVKKLEAQISEMKVSV